MTLIWLAVLGWLTYFILRHSIPALSAGRLWVLWSGMMTPIVVWTVWGLLNQGEEHQIPLLLVVSPLFVYPAIALALLASAALLARWRPTPEENKLDESHQTLPSGPEDINRVQMMQKPELPPSKPPLSSEEEVLLRQCFSLSTYFLHKLEYRLQAVICQGQLRTAADEAYQKVEREVKQRFGDRFLVLLQEDVSGKPFFALVPNPQKRRSDQLRTSTSYRYGLATVLLALTLVTTTLVGLEFSGVSTESLEALLSQPALLFQGLLYAVPLLVILGIHEGGHFWAARRYRLKASLPYFIPVPSFLGTFGAFIQIRSPMPNRKILFDVGIAGPLAGFIATLPLLAWGMAHSQVVPLDPTSSLLTFDALNPQNSILMTLLGRLFLGEALTANGAIALHPVAIAGYLGLIVTALNLMPIGQLDGGHVVHAMFGQKNGAVIGRVAQLVVLVLASIQRELLLWAVLLFFIPAVDEPALNDVSELDDGRDGLGLVALAILFLIILPMPPVLANLIL